MTREEAIERLNGDAPHMRIVKYQSRKGLTRYGRLVEVLSKWAVIESGDDDTGTSRKRVKIADLRPFHKD